MYLEKYSCHKPIYLDGSSCHLVSTVLLQMIICILSAKMDARISRYLISSKLKKIVHTVSQIQWALGIHRLGTTIHRCLSVPHKPSQGHNQKLLPLYIHDFQLHSEMFWGTGRPMEWATILVRPLESLVWSPGKSLQHWVLVVNIHKIMWGFQEQNLHI